MAPEEWPIAAPPAEQGARPARAAGRGRLSTVRKDFFLDPAERLSEQERALMAGMLADLLGSISDEIRAALPAGLGVANDGDGQQLARQLASAGLLDHRGLIALLLRRADEERIGSAVRARSGASPAYLQGLIADSDESVSAAAMALITARGRRRDRLGQPRLDYDDVPQPIARSLAHSVAAAVSGSLPPANRGADSNRHLESAANALAARHDESKRVERMTAALVRALISADRLDEGLIATAAEEGDIGFVAEALAERAGIGGDAAWDHMLDGGSGRFVLLLRLANVSRDLAARLLAGLGDLLGISDLGREIGRFDETDDEGVSSAGQWLRLDPSYRTALHALRGVNG